MRIITLTTDFGTRDEFTGVIKGVILKINPDVTIVDITHEIPAQAVEQAGETLGAAFAWFPEGTIHMAIVDPGVGSDRDILAARHAGHYFIAPDNGLLPVAWGSQHPEQIVRVQKKEMFLHPVSPTFHGRDIIAPVAANLALGVDLKKLGPVVNPLQIQRLALTGPVWKNDYEIEGQISGADRFGNLRANIKIEDILQLTEKRQDGKLLIILGEHQITGLSATYAEHAQGRMIALINSRRQLEIAVTGGSAAELMKTYQGLTIRVKLVAADDS
jgi:S-adenosyl-L-methionine hydrolase (adenosine-forming)